MKGKMEMLISVVEVNIVPMPPVKFKNWPGDGEGLLNRCTASL